MSKLKEWVGWMYMIVSDSLGESDDRLHLHELASFKHQSFQLRNEAAFPLTTQSNKVT